MRITLDTEFIEDGKTIELLSIGMMREDGATYYAETDSAFFLKEGTRAYVDPWILENVVPSLIGTYDSTITRAQIGEDIINFAGPHPEFWAWYADYDWVALCQLYGRMIDLPDTWPMYCKDFKQVSDQFDLGISQQGSVHNALGDAQWLADTMKGYRMFGADRNA